jgi:hypothetical protein
VQRFGREFFVALKNINADYEKEQLGRDTIFFAGAVYFIDQLAL